MACTQPKLPLYGIQMVSMQVLNRIIEFAGMAGAQQFTEEMVADVVGFPGNYTREWSANDSHALGLLREYFRQPQDDLKQLVDTFWPGENFHIEPES